MRSLLVVLLVACGSAKPAIAPDPSNITAHDYIGPEACGECHTEKYAAWSQSLHRRMNQKIDAPDTIVLGNFASSIRYKDRDAVFSRAGGAFTMQLAGTTYRITRTIGVRSLQEYVGIAEGTTEEVRLPFAWWPKRGGWTPQPYFDPWLDEAHFDPYAKLSEPWAERCPWCHSTYPFAQRIARASARPVGHGLEQFFTSAPGGERLAIDQQVTVGISCESCHLGGRAHAAGGPIHLVPIGATPIDAAPKPSTFQHEKLDPAIVNRTCAQCHSGPSPRFPDGSAVRNSSEALDLAGSPCTTIRCTDCHDPHRADSRGDEARSIAACHKCHDPVREHGKHTDAQATCLDCHMPRYVLGIDGFVRSHRISTPAGPRPDAPDACSLCHLETMGPTWLASPSPAMRAIAAGAYGAKGQAKLLDDPVAYVRAYAGFATPAK